MRYRVRVKSESGEQEFELPGDDEAQVRRTVAEMGMSVEGPQRTQAPAPIASPWIPASCEALLGAPRP